MTPATVIDALKAPQSLGILREARGLIEVARLLLRFRDLRRDIARLHTILREKANG